MQKLTLIAALIAGLAAMNPVFATGGTRDEPNHCYVQPNGDRDFDNHQVANQWMQANPSATVKVTVQGGDNINRNYSSSNSSAASTARSIADAVAQGNAELAAQLLNQSSNKNEVLTALQANNSVSNNVLSALREVSATGGNASSMTNLRNAVSSSASATGGSGVGTVTVGNNVYYPSIPVAGAMVSVASTINPGGNITVVKSGCVGQVDITDARTLQATRGTLAGFFAWGYDNGFEHKVRAKSGNVSKLQYGDYTIIGVDDKGRPIQERTVEGFEYVIFAYLTAGGAANGVVRNGVENAIGVNGNQANTSFGTNVMEFSCSFKETRTLIPVPPKPADQPPPPVAEKSWSLSYQVERYKVVPIKGGPRAAKPAYVAKDSTRRVALPPITVTCDGKGDKPAACPGSPMPGTVVDMTGKK